MSPLTRVFITNGKLVHALIAKSILETLLIGALAVFTFINVFPPTFHGWGEVAENSVAGWAVNNSDPWHRVQVQLFIDGQFVANGVADLARPDVSDAGWAKDPWHGYLFALPVLAAGQHEARVFALHDGGRRKSLQLLGDPLVFVIDGHGRVVGGTR